VADDVLVPGQDPSVCVAHRSHRHRVLNAGREEQRRSAVPRTWNVIPPNPPAIVQPFHIPENVAGWKASPIRVAHDELGARDPDREQPLGLGGPHHRGAPGYIGPGRLLTGIVTLMLIPAAFEWAALAWLGFVALCCPLIAWDAIHHREARVEVRQERRLGDSCPAALRGRGRVLCR
jgi:hypothetical protein